MAKSSISDKDYEDLFLTYFRSLTVFAWHILKNQMQAEDMVHDLFLKLYEQRHLITHEKLTKNYLFRAVYNRCMNGIEHKDVEMRNNTQIQEEWNETPEDPFDIFCRIEFEDKLLTALDKLSPKCRQIFEMNRFQGIKNHEIAEKLKLSKRTVETHISNALKVLRTELTNYLPLTVVLFFFA